MTQTLNATLTSYPFPVATNWSVITHRATPLPTTTPSAAIGSASDVAAQISAIGIGKFGASVARLLSRSLRGITCYEVTPSLITEQSEQISTFLYTLQQSDLVFILIDAADLECAAMAQMVGRESCGAGVLTIAIARLGAEMCLPEHLAGEGKWYHSLFTVSGRSLPPQPEPVIPEGDALTGYATRHMITAITTLITHQTGICIDFADVAAIMREGSMGRLGVGVGSSDSRAVTAAKAAIERLEAQGVPLAHASGVLVSVHGSSALTIDDFDDASRVVHDRVAEDANIIVGLISDEQMGYNVKVTVMATYS
ncbi:FtsZ/tubulin family protein [Geomonas propionica]|uniref:Tubulin/FtsZ 2-layer sandwich domain-containing protein n=1 Tax=Geomonas propionica TaxID=2798582 RepID=A0ABS0YZ46_9BACT|nr:hypothetical protein [Geomonas propionica]MBJ6802777.1 hypothetical protein [Geomonas propionica]